MPHDKIVSHDWVTIDPAVPSTLPPDGKWVETKIANESMGDWCFIPRFHAKGTWWDKDNKWDGHPPTHWHHD